MLKLNHCDDPTWGIPWLSKNKLVVLHIFRYTVLNKVQDGRSPKAGKNPADFLPPAAGKRARAGAAEMSKKHMGSSIDDFLKEEGIFEEAQAQAVKEVVAWQLAQAMKQQKISKNKMAALLKTSRTQVDRLLDPKHDITLLSLQRAAAMVGRRVMIELV